MDGFAPGLAIPAAAPAPGEVLAGLRSRVEAELAPLVKQIDHDGRAIAYDR